MNEIAIYSNSWGESDDTNFGGPDSIVQGALSRGVKLVSFLQLKLLWIVYLLDIVDCLLNVLKKCSVKLVYNQMTISDFFFSGPCL